MVSEAIHRFTAEEFGFLLKLAALDKATKDDKEREQFEKRLNEIPSGLNRQQRRRLQAIYRKVRSS